MGKTITTPKTKAELLESDRSRAAVLMQSYSDLKAEHEKLTKEVAEKCRPFLEDFERQTKPITAQYKDRFDTIKASAEAAEKELLEIGERQKKSKAFGTDGNWRFKDLLYYLHIKHETVPKLGDEFSLDKFIKRFGDYVDVKYKIADLKKALADGDLRKKFQKLHFDLGFNKVVEIKKEKS